LEVGVYDTKPENLLTQVSADDAFGFPTTSFCAGFELKAWRCNQLADHFIEWLADYALMEDELSVSHGNMYVRLREAAARIYSSKNYERRGEIGEIALHAISRQFFDTIPITPRVFYLTSSNEVVKSFDSVHVRYVADNPEVWLGEAKFFENRSAGVADAIASVRKHIDQGFLQNEKLVLGPQISKNIPKYREIRSLFSNTTSLDELFQTAVFPICIVSDSDATQQFDQINDSYREAVSMELSELANSLSKSGLQSAIRLALFYLPLGSKSNLAKAFDDRLKGLNP
jgi:hypothetical protein